MSRDSDTRTGPGEIERLLEIMAALRHPRDGCPWDVEQSFETIAPYTIEEAHEVAEAIARDDLDALADELGDLLFQVVFHARMAQERGAFAFADVVDAIVDKMVRRHPHVFAEERVADASAQTRAWEAHKEAERRARGHRRASVLDGVPPGLPAAQRAQKLQKRAARVGFDWSDAVAVIPKLREEIDEIEGAIEGGAGDEAIAEEVGDLLFSGVNLARRLGVDAEGALRAANIKFERRFQRMEQAAARDGLALDALEHEALERLWNRAKRD